MQTSFKYIFISIGSPLLLLMLLNLSSRAVIEGGQCILLDRVQFIVNTMIACFLARYVHLALQ